MPRKADPKNAAKNARQAKWRRNLKAAQRPEGSLVDVALAAAFSAVLAELDDRRAVPQGMLDVVAAAVDILEHKECDRKEAARIVNRRLRFRDDLPELRTYAAGVKSVSTRP
jgi:hypothetical protein